MTKEMVAEKKMRMMIDEISWLETIWLIRHQK